MEPLYIYDLERVRIGEISDYVTFENEENFFDVDKVVLRVDFNKENLNLLRIGNYLARDSNFYKLYRIEHFSKVLENGIQILEIFAYSLKDLLKQRVIPRQQRYIGNLTKVINDFIRYNAVDVENERRIPGLIIGNDDFGPFIESSRSGGTVFDQVFGLAQQYGCTIELLSNPDTTLYTSVKVGTDRSSSTNDAVFFSESFENVLSSQYFLDLINYKNVVYVAGQGEGEERRVVSAGAQTGIFRRELYVDARDLGPVYNDENNNRIELTDEQYDELLIQRGLEKLSENQLIETFEADVVNSQFVLGVDYFLGDIVTFIDEAIGISLDARVNSIKTVINREGTTITPFFGTGIPRRFS